MQTSSHRPRFELATSGAQSQRPQPASHCSRSALTYQARLYHRVLLKQIKVILVLVLLNAQYSIIQYQYRLNPGNQLQLTETTLNLCLSFYRVNLTTKNFSQIFTSYMKYVAVES